MSGPWPGNTPQPAEKHPILAVLVVDDESLIRWSLRTALLARGHEVATAGNAQEALALLTAEPGRFDVVLLDYRLPDRNDLTLLEDVRRISPRSAVFMMTAFADSGMQAGAKELGARTVVDKPFHVKTMVSLVESVAL